MHLLCHPQHLGVARNVTTFLYVLAKVMKMEFEYLDHGDPTICESILRSLPEWFGIEEAIVDYIDKAKEQAMIVALDNNRPAGFLSLKNHSIYTSEIYVMGILPEYHRIGIGKKLLTEAEKYLEKDKIEFLQVKTLSSDRECEYYKKTRLFYQSYGFKEVETFPTLWDESNPCLLMIKVVNKSEDNTTLTRQAGR